MPQNDREPECIAVPLELNSLLKLFTPPQAIDFWQSAASEVERLSHCPREHLRLCGAIQDLGCDVQKPRSLTSLPRVARRLSVSDTQKAIFRLKERLLATADGANFLTGVFCTWVLSNCKLALLAVLNAVNCPCDENGTLKGPVPSISPSEATAAILPLLAQFEARELALVCCVLVLNGRPDGGYWACLAECRDSLLSRLVSYDLLAPGRTEFSKKVPELLGSVEQELEGRESHAFPGGGNSTTQEADKPFALEGDAEVSRRASTNPLPMQDVEVLAAAVACSHVAHATDPAFSGNLEIQRVASVLRQPGGEEREDLGVMLEGARALVKLVLSGETLKDAEVDTLEALIQAAFGRAVSIAAVRGNLRLIGCNAPMHAGMEPQKDHDSEFGVQSSPPAVPVLHSETAIGATSMEASEHAWSTASAHPSTVQEKGGAIDQPEPEESPAAAEFKTYRGQYDQHFWINPRGEVARAPWTEDSFAAVLKESVQDAWNRQRPDLAYLYARGLRAHGSAEPISIQDLAAADLLLDTPSSLSAGTDRARTDRLREVLNRTVEDAPCGFGLMLVMEAVRPTLPTKLTSEDIQNLVARANYKDSAIATLIIWMLQTWQAEMNPLQQLRERVLAEPPEDYETLKVLLANVEQTFRDTVATYWSAAGGRLQRTHCRRAWSEFVDKEIATLRQDFSRLSSQPKLNPSGSQGQIRASLTRMAKSYVAIMDRANVRFQDRTAADGAVAAIADSLLRVGDILQRLSIQQQRTRAAFDTCPEDEARRVLNEVSSDATDQICARIFRSALLETSDLNPLRLPCWTLVQAPNFVKHVSPVLLADLDLPDSSGRIPVGAISDPRAASALLLALNLEDGPNPDSSADVIRVLREEAIEADRRDILSVLSPTNVLETHERTLLNRAALEMIELLFGRVQELEALWGICEELMTEEAPALKDVAVEARDLVENSSQANTLLDGRLIDCWALDNISRAQAVVRKATTARLALAQERSAEVATQLKQLFSLGKYREAVALLHLQEPLESRQGSASTRLTIWREDALEIIQSPTQALAGEFRGAVEAQHALVDTWLDTPAATERDGLHRLVYAVISGEAYRPPTEVQRRGIVPLGDLRDFRERKTLIDCATLRDYFQASGRNPSFFPQLAVLSKIVIVSPAAGARIGANALDEYARAISVEHENALVVFLEPGMPRLRREDLCRGLRERGLLGAIVDDYDLCRICQSVRDSDAPAFIPFLEILFEQQNLERFSPFSTQDGQHIRVETFVGRTTEADALAFTGKYSRVFSGRKLGKSALLKYVARRYDKQNLPSGQRLHVLFITIAGGDTEQYVVDCIIDQMSRRFGRPEPQVMGEPKDRRQRARLSAYMHQFLVSNPNDSLLLILDEADSFVEEQLASYDAVRETSLSFCLLKELPADIDRNDLPRIRTIFSGYRVTNTSDGVWANAGDVLVLHPLSESEAVRFVTGTLARVGVDIGDHGSYIARRCGRQPAVLIRFGEVLLKHLTRAGFAQGRETLRVSSGSVTAALTDQIVADEIRTVVANNFQGNRIGHAIFGATLLCLKDLAPGHALTDGPSQVLAKLQEIDSDLSWLTRIDASPTAVIERNLQEFIDRELLTVSDSQRFGMREYRLKFPHFLPVLTQADTSLDVRKLIRGLRDKSPSRLGRCALSESMLERVRYCYRETSIKDCRLVVVGGHWLTALLDPKCGLANRLGSASWEQSQLDGSLDEDEIFARICAGARLLLDPPVTAWQSLLSVQSERPLVIVGGIQWLRTALEHQIRGEEIPIQIIAQGRLSDDTMRWWLEGARALHFESPESLDDFVKLTDGIPFFAAAFDRELHALPATVPSAEALEQAVASLGRQGMDLLARELLAPLERGALTTREVELLIMAVKVSQELEGALFDLEGEFAEYWECVQDADPFHPPMSLPEDRLALLVLIACGLISVQDEAASLSGASLGNARVDPNGPVTRLVDAMERAREV